MVTMRASRSSRAMCAHSRLSNRPRRALPHRGVPVKAVAAAFHVQGNSAAKADSSRHGAARRDAETKEEELSDEYSTEMQQKMGTSLTYRHEDGMNYNRILDDLIVGSCPQVPEDVERLHEQEGVGPVICLQQDSDMEYFSLDVAPIQARCADLGLSHLRLRINDFDPFHLRQRLPDVIKDFAAGHRESGGTAYVHCTAGMGRAPAVALAYMWWVKGMHLEDAHELLLSKRMCHPKLYAIRQAAGDILYGGEPQDIKIRKRGSSMSSVVEIAGLDIGWGNRIAMEKVGADTWEVCRTLPPGQFPFKFIMDDVWSYDADLYTVFDGENTNNAVDVIPSGLSETELASRQRVLQSGGRLTSEEQARLQEFLCV